MLSIDCSDLLIRYNKKGLRITMQNDRINYNGRKRFYGKAEPERGELLKHRLVSMLGLPVLFLACMVARADCSGLGTQGKFSLFKVTAGVAGWRGRLSVRS